MAYDFEGASAQLNQAQGMLDEADRLRQTDDRSGSSLLGRAVLAIHSLGAHGAVSWKVMEQNARLIQSDVAAQTRTWVDDRAKVIAAGTDTPEGKAVGDLDQEINTLFRRADRVNGQATKIHELKNSMDVAAGRMEGAARDAAPTIMSKGTLESAIAAGSIDDAQRLLGIATDQMKILLPRLRETRAFVPTFSSQAEHTPLFDALLSGMGMGNQDSAADHEKAFMQASKICADISQRLNAPLGRATRLQAKLGDRQTEAIEIQEQALVPFRQLAQAELPADLHELVAPSSRRPATLSHACATLATHTEGRETAPPTVDRPMVMRSAGLR